MTQHGKKYKESLTKADRESMHGVAEAVELVKGLASAKFDETVELAVRLGVDPRKADQIVRGTLSLPSGTGRTERVAVFAAGEAAAEARAAGADEVGADDLVAKINGGFLDFDVAIATPDLMGQVGTLGRVLGPRGLMPNPKTGTVTTDVGKAVAEFKGGRVEYRTDKVGNVHIRVGQGVLHGRAAGGQHPRRRRRAPAGEAALVQGPLLPVADRLDHHEPRGPHRPGEGPLHRRGAGRPGLTPPTRSEGLRPPYYASPHSSPPMGGRALNPIRQRPPVHPWVPKRPTRAGLTRRHRARRHRPACAVAPHR